MRLFTLIGLILFCLTDTHAQIDLLDQERSLEGYWRGGFIRSGNSLQLVSATIFREEDALRASVKIDEWIYPPGRVSTVKEEDDFFYFETYYGKAKMQLDSTFMEMVGTVGEANPPIHLHLKKSPKSIDEPQIVTKDIQINRAGANISGTLYYPDHLEQPMACAVIVHGRGCAPRSWKINRAKKLASLGIAIFIHDKRGSAPSEFPCEQSTHEMNVDDLVKIVEKLSKEEKINPDKIGLIASSAGAWTAPAVAKESNVPIAFLITQAGPTTSVLEQQVDGMEAFLKEKSFSQTSINEAKRYTELMFAENDRQAAYEEMQQLLEKGEASGWTEFLVEDDYLSDPSEFDRLWVQRFSYDPAKDLMAYQGPYLAVFGENDPIVPYQKQISRLEELMKKTGKTNYEVKVILSGGHSLSHDHQFRTLNESQDFPTNYFKFNRSGYGSYQYLVDFLNKHVFLMHP